MLEQNFRKTSKKAENSFIIFYVETLKKCNSPKNTHIKKAIPLKILCRKMKVSLIMFYFLQNAFKESIIFLKHF